jgi:Zn-dependent protease with chaperone function
MYIANPLPGAHMSALFSTHPPISERVRRLRAYDRVHSSARMPFAAPARGIS